MRRYNGVVPPNRVPRLNRQEEEILRREAFWQRQAYLIARLRQLINLGVAPVLAFGNIMKGGKTTLALYIASVIAEFTRCFVIIAPTTANTATSTLADRAGIPESERLSVSRLISHLYDYDTFRKLSRSIPKTPHGVGIISEDAGSVIDDNSAAGNDQLQTFSSFLNMLRMLYPLTQVLILDLGNDNIERHSVAVLAAQAADQITLVATRTVPESAGTLSKTMNGLSTGKQLIGLPESSAEPMPGTAVTIARKTQVATVVMSGVTDQSEPTNFDTLTRSTRVQSVFEEDTFAWKGRGMEVPYDPYIASMQPCNLWKIAPETLQAILEIAVHLLEQATVSQRIYVPPLNIPSGTPRLTSSGKI